MTLLVAELLLEKIITIDDPETGAVRLILIIISPPQNSIIPIMIHNLGQMDAGIVLR